MWNMPTGFQWIFKILLNLLFTSFSWPLQTFTFVLTANSFLLTRHRKVCDFPLPICETGREQEWLMATISQSSTGAREKVGAFRAWSAGNSPGFEPVPLGLNPGSATDSGILSNSLSEPRCALQQIVDHTTYGGGVLMQTRHTYWSGVGAAFGGSMQLFHNSLLKRQP